jgi:hypothetical protein
MNLKEWLVLLLFAITGQVIQEQVSRQICDPVVAGG